MLLLPKSFLVTYRLPDDAMYYFTIARNMMSGKGISFDGVDPSNGFHPLWLFLISPFYLLGSDWVAVYGALIFQSLLDTGIIVLCGIAAWRSLELHEHQRWFASLTAALLYAFNPIAIVRGINGLESTVFALVFTLWLIEFIATWRDTRRAWWKLAILTAFLFLARTDSVFISVPSLLALFVLHTKNATVTVSNLIGPFIVAVVIVAPWLIWSKATFGSFVQSSGEAVAIFADAKYAIEYAHGGKSQYLLFETFRSWAKLFFYSSAGIGALALLASLTRHSKRRSLHVLTFPLLGCLILLAYHTLARGFIRDWYILQLIAFFSIVAGVTFTLMAEYRRLFLFVTLAAFLGLWITELSTPRLSSQTAFVSAPPAEGDANIIGAFNSGYLGFYKGGQSRVINLDGVVNHDILYYLRTHDLRQYLDSVGIDQIEDYRGTLGGYRNLFAPNLTQGFTLTDSVDAGNGELIEVWRRAPAK